MASVMYMFSAEGERGGALGLPGHVFQQKMLEWIPNVRYYSSKEYPRLIYALNYNVQGSLALPIFEPSRQSCIGVFELIMTSQKINYAPEVDKVCKALEEGDGVASIVMCYTKGTGPPFACISPTWMKIVFSPRIINPILTTTTRKTSSCAICDNSNLASICPVCVNYRLNEYSTTLKSLKSRRDLLYSKLSEKLVAKSKADDQLGWRVLQSKKLARLMEKLRLKRKQYLQGNTKIEKMSYDLKVKYELLESAMTVLEKEI